MGSFLFLFVYFNYQDVKFPTVWFSDEGVGWGSGREGSTSGKTRVSGLQ